MKGKGGAPAAGPLVVDLPGTRLTPEDAELLRHPLVGGVLLFARNQESRRQVTALARAVRRLKSPALLVMADQEGGRVQRLRHGFAPLPAFGLLGRSYERRPERALRLAADIAWLMAAEIAAAGLDLSLTPVLDLGGNRSVIGDRAFHRDPDIVCRLGRACRHGLRQAGMAAVAKHFPGHGAVAGDTHRERCTDPREYSRIRDSDLRPFAAAIREGIEGVMMGLVTYPAVCEGPALYSAAWIRDILKGRLGFKGTVLSDDIGMEAAAVVADHADRFVACREAGCDLVLLCNRRQQVERLVDRLRPQEWLLAARKLDALRGAGGVRDSGFPRNCPRWRRARAALAALRREAEAAAPQETETAGAASS
ncbi:MAG: beta-N-acetylhexosaminidase [Gammaproteobacteria bacterium]|nr:beta-N-acetylhexosaminidase [Gammaproteobacteria bacterium]